MNQRFKKKKQTQMTKPSGKTLNWSPSCCIDENGKNDFKYMCYEESFEISHYRIGTKALNQYCEDPEI